MPATSLIVHADAACRDFLCRTLSHAGMMILPVATARDAARVLQSNAVDFAIVPCDPHDNETRALCVALAAGLIEPAPKVIALVDEDASGVMASEAGAAAILRTPLLSQRVLDVCARVLRGATIPFVPAPTLQFRGEFGDVQGSLYS